MQAADANDIALRPASSQARGRPQMGPRPEVNRLMKPVP
jgi:hypothetical protein